MNDRVRDAMENRKLWLQVWSLVEKLDGEIRYQPTTYALLQTASTALAKLVRPGVLASRLKLNDALVEEPK
jgi:hypothetical protein